ncbi:acyltransferase [Gordonia spumicola]|uniref:Acyltransferase n=1 Tax=Gordonia spumicola TaxID=589161 RepID=A0A7I9VFQ7_9ACTN|nr:acyltransferase [Gordonia spumicola]GEE03850.1 acyltransferase [Gordonia spumicola]
MQQTISRPVVVERAVEERTAPQRPPRALTADFVRVVLFTCVVIAHSVNGIAYGPDELQATSLLGVMLHVTRYGFVAVTLFVLVLSTRGRTVSPVTFWRRRFGLVVGPYLVWSVIYMVSPHLIGRDDPFPSAGSFVGDTAHAIATGEAKYQLYFLLISMQIYLAFPVLAWLFKRTENRPWWVVGTAAVIQVGMFSVYQYLPRPTGPVWNVVYENLWKTLPMYALFIAIGGVAAQHYEQLEEWLREHTLGVVVACAAGAAVSIVWFFCATSFDDVPPGVTSPWNAAFLPWWVASFVLLWLGATWWDAMRRAGHRVGARTVSAATLRAFGVFAVHPLILDLLARFGFFGELFARFPDSGTARGAALVAATLLLSLLAVEVLLRTPFSKWLVARDRIPMRRQTPTPTTA